MTQTETETTECEWCGAEDHVAGTFEDCPNCDPFATESWNERW